MPHMDDLNEFMNLSSQLNTHACTHAHTHILSTKYCAGFLSSNLGKFTILSEKQAFHLSFEMIDKRNLLLNNQKD